MATDPIIAEIPPPGRSLRVFRAAFALGFVVVPFLSIVALAVLWAWSCQVEETYTLSRKVESLDPSTNRVAFDSVQFQAETARGVLGFLVRRELLTSPAASATPARSTDSGRWRFTRVETSRLGDASNPYRPFERDRRDIGITRTLHWSHFVLDHSFASMKFFSTVSVDQIVAPCWVWMLPLTLPPIWWFWSPSGRLIPRLTIRRTLGITAYLAMILAALAALGRSAESDRALMVVAEFAGNWTYGPDPSGSGRPVVTAVELDNMYHRQRITDADIPRIRAGLSRLPHLRALTISPSEATGAGLAELVAGLPDLEILRLAGTNADDTTLAAVGGCRKLRELWADNTPITDAGLKHLTNHPTLEMFLLNNVKLTDAGLAHLAGLPRLRRLFLVDSRIAVEPNFVTPITDPALIRLANSLPALEFIQTPANDSVHDGKVHRITSHLSY